MRCGIARVEHISGVAKPRTSRSNEIGLAWRALERLEEAGGAWRVWRAWTPLDSLGRLGSSSEDTPPHGATRGTTFELLHGRLQLVARRQGAVLQPVLRDVRAPPCFAFLNHFFDLLRYIQQATFPAHLHHRRIRPFRT